MPLQGEAKKDYQRDYMRRRRAGLLTPRRPKAAPPPVKPAPEKPKPHCWFCGETASDERFLIGKGHPQDVHICESCVAEATALIAKQRIGKPSTSLRVR
jgi:ClpX C4-type zinc finger